MAHELRVNYASKIDEVLRSAQVTDALVNTFYEGAATAGAVKIPVRDAEVEVGDYSKTNLSANTVKYGNTAYITAPIDNDKFVNEYIDGYEADAIPDNIKAQRVTSAGYSLANTMDNTALKTLVYALQGKDKNGTTFADVRTGKTGAKVTATDKAFEDIVDLGTKLDKADVPADGRWVIVTPEVYASLIKSSDFVKQSDLSQEIVRTGAVGMVNGMVVYKANKLEGIASQPTGSGVSKITAIAGHKNWFTKVAEWQTPVSIHDGNSDANIVGGSLLKGRKVYTYEVTKPQAFAYRQ